MSIFGNPSFYVSIFSSVCFLASEILPFLPTNGNGILHTIVKLLSDCNKEPKIEKGKEKEDEEKEEKDETELDAKINFILDKLNNINN